MTASFQLTSSIEHVAETHHVSLTTVVKCNMQNAASMVHANCNMSYANQRFA